MIKKSICYFLLLDIISSAPTHACPTGCSACNGASDNCTGCSPGYQLSGTTCIVCPSGVCTLCQLPCATCVTDSSDCLTCNDSANQAGLKCLCNDGYIMNTSNYFCDQCQFPCDTCQTNINYCLTCTSTYTLNNTINTCECQNDQFELNGTTKTCVNCTNPCQTCTSSATFCTSCVSGLNRKLLNIQCVCDDGFYGRSSCTCPVTFYMNASFMCQSCVTPCLNCTSNLLCTSCIDNYFLYVDTCLQCNLPCYNCVDLATKCTSCADGYFMNNLVQCQSCIYPCSKCENNANNCLDCASTYVLSTLVPNTCEYIFIDCIMNQKYYTNILNLYYKILQRYCIEIKMNNIIKIYPKLQKERKHNDKEIDLSAPTHACPTGCSACNGASDNCTGCSPGYQLSGTTCIVCPSGVCTLCQLPCATCVTDSSDCLTCNDSANQAGLKCLCNDGYIMNTSNYFCDQCQFPCDTCQTNINYCLTCTSTYTLNNTINTCECQNDQFELNGTTKTCVNCTNPCQTCTSSATFCTSCVSGLNRKLLNIQCVCDDGFYGSTTCTACNLPCKNCNSSIFCTSCNDPTHQTGSSCTCPVTFYMNASFMCQSCVTPCLNCTSNLLCTSCIDNYFLYVDTCLQCNLPCYNCVDLATKCTSCADGYFMNNLVQCQSCIYPCSKCENNANNCLDCASTYVLSTLVPNTCECPYNSIQVLTNNPINCQLCTQPCDTCSGTSTHCLTCIDTHLSINSSFQCVCNSGYVFDSSFHCIPCQSPCQTCSDKFQCICKDTFYSNTISTCAQCTYPCKQCDTYGCLTCIDSNKTINTSQDCVCKPGFYEEGLNCAQCVFPCKTCEIKQDQCLTCFDNYQILLNNNCICQDGYFEINMQCQQCGQQCQTCSQKSDNCLSCNQEKNRKLQKNTCICLDGYFENDQKQCWSCDSNEGKSSKDCKYKDCSDNVWTQGEDCDDGNNFTRDGCSNCKIDNDYSCINTLLEPSFCFKCNDNCKKCQMNKIQLQVGCIQCNQGFFLFQNQCSQCAEQCLDCKNSASNCISCRYQTNSSGTCQLCQNNLGYYSDQINKKCYSKCGDSLKTLEEQCDDGNLLSGDGCNQFCQMEKKFLCKNGICITPEYPIPILFSYGDQSLYNNKRKFKLEYNTLLNLTQDNIIEKQLQLYFKKQTTITPIDIPYMIEKQYQFNNQANINFSVSIEIQFNRSTTNEEFLIKYLSVDLIISNQGYSQIENEVSTTIPKFMFIDQSAVAQVEMATSSSSILLYIMAGMAAGAVLFGGLEIFYNLLDTIQMLSYLKYINTQYPYNLEQFFEFFGFAQLSFISKYLNLQEQIDPYIAYENLKPIPEKILMDDYNSLFIINGSSILFVWLTLLGVYFLSIQLPKILSKFKFKYYNDIPEKLNLEQKLKFWLLAVKIYIVELCSIVVSEFFYSGIVRTFIATAYDYSFTMSLQLSALQIDSSDAIVGFSSFLALIALGIYLITIYFVIKICGDTNFQIYQYQNKLKYQSLFEGIKNDSYSKYFNAIGLCQKLLFIIILIFCYKTPFYQTINLILLSVLQVIYLIIFKPLNDKKEFIKQFSCEINKAIALFFILWLVYDEETKIFSENVRSNIGWICIGSISLIFAIQIIIDAIQQWMLLIKKYRKLRRFVDKFYQNIVPPKPQQADHRLFTQGSLKKI
ncbi:unnamed protein product [Paramecium sonneborni]|uniref:EGF-like domain-containing protein n=1 Tax=Paramecium sonneborni TaxID=65129 RepID=A0A8S1R3T0_9CILI|nr:unnamed protein product [Paramecium sonneborni]